MSASGVETSDTAFLEQLFDAENGKTSFLQVLIAVIALLLNMLDGYDITAMAYAAHSLGEQLNIPPTQLGVLFSVALAGMMLGAMFLAPFSDVVGRRKMLLICVTVTGASVLITGYSDAFWQLVVLRTISGLGVGCMLASVTAITSEYAIAKYRNLTVVAIVAGYPLGATIGGFIAAPLLSSYGWQSVFIFGGVATLCLVPVIYVWMPESLHFLSVKQPPSALDAINQTLKRMKRPTLSELPKVNRGEASTSSSVFSLLEKSVRSKTLTLWTAFFFCFIALYFLMSWIPKLAVSSGMSESQGVYAAVAFNGGGVIGIVILGWLSARMGLSKIIGTFLGVAGMCMILFFMVELEMVQVLASLMVIGFFLSGGFTGLYAVAAKIYPTEIRTTGVGWAIGLGRFGAVVGPYIGGLLIAGGVSMELNFFIFAWPLLIAAVLSFYLSVR